MVMTYFGCPWPSPGHSIPPTLPIPSLGTHWHQNKQKNTIFLWAILEASWGILSRLGRTRGGRNKGWSSRQPPLPFWSLLGAALRLSWGVLGGEETMVLVSVCPSLRYASIPAPQVRGGRGGGRGGGGEREGWREGRREGGKEGGREGRREGGRARGKGEM